MFSKDENKFMESCCHKNIKVNHQHHGTIDVAHDFLFRFIIVTFLLVPLFLVSSTVIKFTLSSAIFYFSLIFFEHAWEEIKSSQYGMMTLVSLAVGSGYIFSALSTFIPIFSGTEFYLEISTLIWILLFGHYLEARASTAAGDALSEAAKLLPKKAHLLDKEGTKDIDVNNLKEGDVVLIKPGEKVPADGMIIRGQADFNEALLSGEAKPVAKCESDGVVAGAICLDSSVEVKLTRVGENSTVGQIKKLIEKAQGSKPIVARLADRAARCLTFIALFAAVLTFIFWVFIMGKTYVFGLTLAITVLVITCPHALGLAIPAVSSIATALAVKNGIFIKNMGKIEVIKDAKKVIFDKTGTLTEGKPKVTDVIFLPTTDLLRRFASLKLWRSGQAGYKLPINVLQLAASLEKNSEHPLAVAILNRAKEENIELLPVDDFKSVPGQGISAMIKNIKLKVLFGNKKLINSNNITVTQENNLQVEKLEHQGKTVMLLAINNNLVGLIAVADTVKETSRSAVKRLQKMGIDVYLMTGDNFRTAKTIGQEVGISDNRIFAEILPEEKYKKVKMLQENNTRVIMVGDGVNDAPGLMQSDAGLAIGAGVDLAVEAGDVILMRNNPEDVARLIILSRAVYRKMMENLFWALGYNIIAIPAAAGFLSPFGFFLRPELGAFIMSLSTVIVVINAMSLRKLKL